MHGSSQPIYTHVATRSTHIFVFPSCHHTLFLYTTYLSCSTYQLLHCPLRTASSAISLLLFLTTPQSSSPTPPVLDLMLYNGRRRLGPSIRCIHLCTPNVSPCMPVRSFPCQDTFVVRIKYAARIHARTICLRWWQRAMWNYSSRTLGRMMEEFVMKQAMPPYLFAFAVGRLGLREVGQRTRLCAEAGISLLDGAVRELAGPKEEPQQCRNSYTELMPLILIVIHHFLSPYQTFLIPHPTFSSLVLIRSLIGPMNDTAWAEDSLLLRTWFLRFLMKNYDRGEST